PGPAELRVDGAAELHDLLIARDVARHDEWLLERCAQLAHVLFESLARVCQRKAHAGLRESLRDRPGNRTLVGYPDNQSVFTRESGHGRQSAIVERLWRSAIAGR